MIICDIILSLRLKEGLIHMNKKMRIRFFVSAVAIVLACLLLTRMFENKFTSVTILDVNLDGYNNLMIVAHPDDETIFGGGHLLKDKYLVVCVTAGNDVIRSRELLKAMKATDDKCLMLGYPDKTMGKRDKWTNCKSDIKADLTKIINYKHWKTIVTHSPQGEYGHIHHKMTNEIVTQIYNEVCDNDQTLYYFAHYYTKEEIPAVEKGLVALDKKTFDEKYEYMHKVYKSQFHVLDKLDHIMKYEEWQKYSKDEVTT